MTGDPFVIRLSRPKGRVGQVALVLAPVAVLLVIAQVAIDPSLPNFYFALLSAASMLITFTYCAREGLIERFPVSTVAVVGFNVATHSLALVAQTLYLKPVTYNLQSSDYSIDAILAVEAVLIATHFVYTHFSVLQAPGQFLARRVLTRIWVFRMPREAELWAIGLVSLGAIWVSRILFGSSIEFGDVGGKLLQGISGFAIAPGLIPFRGLYRNQPVKTSPLSTLALPVYLAVLIVTALALNARVIFSTLLFSMLFSTILLIAMRRLVISPRMRLIAIGSLIFLVPAMSAMEDLATAMVVARQIRLNATPTELIAETLHDFSDKELLARTREFQQASTSASEYSENYIDSSFIARLTYTKVIDVTMTASRRFTEVQREVIRQDFRDSLIRTMPTPLANALGFHVDKAAANYAVGDLYDNLAFGSALEGFRTGSSITNARDIFGFWWLPVMALIYLVMFPIIDSFALRTRAGTILSPIVFLNFFPLFFRTVLGSGLVELFGAITRGYLQNIVLWVMLSLGARLVVPMFSRPSQQIGGRVGQPV